MRGGQGRQPQAEAPRRPQPNPSGRPRNPYDDLFGEMFETGRKTQDEYLRGLQGVFDQFLKGMEKRP